MEAIENIELVPLSDKHQMVLDQYLLCWNQTESYARVYGVDRRSASTLAARLFKDDNFAAHLEIAVNDIHMSANEAIKLQTDIARGDITEFIDGFGSMDINALKASGKGKLVKKIKQRTTITTQDNGNDKEVTETEFELYPADVAQERILRLSGKLSGNSQRPHESAAPNGQITASAETLLQLAHEIEAYAQAEREKARAIDAESR